MIVVSRCESRDPSGPPTQPLERRLGAPCVFKGARGVFHAGAGPVGVVFCAPWGLEERVTRAAWHGLAEAVGGLGVPALTFDYQGTAESLGAMDEIEDVARWVRSIGEAADFLRAYSGVKRFVLIGQSLGAALAVEAAAARTDVAGLILIAPVASGRAYLRELQGAVKPSGGPVAHHGFVLSAPLAASLAALDVTRSGVGGVASVIICDRADRKAGAEVLEHFKRKGVTAAFEASAPARLDLSADAASQPLPVAREAILAALARFVPAPAPHAGPRAAPRVPLLPATLRGETFKEEPVVLGLRGGMLCHPARPRLGAPAVVILKGVGAVGGRRRAAVETARTLAAAGVTSLRVDDATRGDEVGDAVWATRVAEAEAAVAALIGRGHGEIALAGAGDGATLALAVAAADPSIGQVVAAHAPAWVPDTDAAGHHGWFFRARRHVRRIGLGLPPWFRALVLRDETPARVRRLFAQLARQGTRVVLVCGEDDRSLADLRACHGGRGDPRGCLVARPRGNRAGDWLVPHLVEAGIVEPGAARQGPEAEPRAAA